MKTVTLVVMVTVCFTQIVNAQQRQDEILFDQATEHFENEDYAEAAKVFRQLMVEHPKSPAVPRAHYNLAFTYFRMQEYGTAKSLFLEILSKPYNEKDENSLMEPYALYKHHSCRILASIALEEKDFKSAEKYIHMFDKKYPYQHFCGNEWSAYDMYKAVMISKVYEGKGETTKAMEELLPFIFSNALASNDEVLSELSEILETHFSREETQAEFKRALASLHVQENKKQTSASIQLYGVSIPVSENFFEPTESNSGKEYYQHVVETNPLFKKFL